MVVNIRGPSWQCLGRERPLPPVCLLLRYMAFLALCPLYFFSIQFIIRHWTKHCFVVVWKVYWNILCLIDCIPRFFLFISQLLTLSLSPSTEKKDNPILNNILKIFIILLCPRISFYVKIESKLNISKKVTNIFL